MWFWKFKKACYKYRFNFLIDSFGIIYLRPTNTFEIIEVIEDKVQYNKLFKMAIDVMKEYRINNKKERRAS